MRRGKTQPRLRGLYACVLLVSAATLLFEIALTRIFAVTQGYHFAFLAISLALLGFGASGTALALVPRLASRDIRPVVAGAGLLFAVTSTGGLYLTNVLPFDAYTLLWEPSQLAYLALYYLALAVPFFFAGSIVGACLAKHPSRAGVLYGANLVGAGDRVPAVGRLPAHRRRGGLGSRGGRDCPGRRGGVGRAGAEASRMAGPGHTGRCGGGGRRRAWGDRAKAVAVQGGQPGAAARGAPRRRSTGGTPSRSWR